MSRFWAIQCSFPRFQKPPKAHYRCLEAFGDVLVCFSFSSPDYDMRLPPNSRTRTCPGGASEGVFRQMAGAMGRFRTLAHDNTHQSRPQPCLWCGCLAKKRSESRLKTLAHGNIHHSRHNHAYGAAIWRREAKESRGERLSANNRLTPPPQSGIRRGEGW